MGSFELIPAASFRHHATRKKFHPHYLDCGQSTTVRFYRNFLPCTTKLWNFYIYTIIHILFHKQKLSRIFSLFVYLLAYHGPSSSKNWYGINYLYTHIFHLYLTSTGSNYYSDVHIVMSKHKSNLILGCQGQFKIQAGRKGLFCYLDKIFLSDHDIFTCAEL